VPRPIPLEAKAFRAPEGTPYDDLYGEAPPERGTFYGLQVYLTIIPRTRIGNGMEDSQRGA